MIGLHKAAEALRRHHDRDVALQLGHLARPPEREVAEGHFAVFVDDLVDAVEDLKPDIVDRLQLLLEFLGAVHRVEQDGLGAAQPGQRVEALDQVRAAHIDSGPAPAVCRR